MEILKLINKLNSTVMKHKISIIFIVLILISAGVNAQETQFGVKAGVNFSNMSVEDADDKTLKTGFHAGVFGKYGITEYFAIQPELLFTTKGITSSYDALIAEGEAKINLNYIELPVNLVYNLSEDFAFHFGPYIGYLAGANVSTNNELLGFLDLDTNDDISRDNFKPLDFGLTAGLGFTLEQFVFGFKYNLGLTQVAKDNIIGNQLLGDARNNVIQIYAGILF
jgi:hypothetical protein